MDVYDETTTQHSESSSGFIFRHHHSKTVKDFYHMFYEQDSSLSLQQQYLIQHAVTLADDEPEPTWEFRLATLLLPATYTNATKDTYRQYLQDFGTHFMVSRLQVASVDSVLDLYNV
jgi:hypothetical protein